MVAMPLFLSVLTAPGCANALVNVVLNALIKALPRALINTVPKALSKDLSCPCCYAFPKLFGEALPRGVPRVLPPCWGDDT